MVDLQDIRDLPAACEWARQASLKLVPLGQGSNVVLAGDLDALVLRLANRGVDVLEDNDNGVLLRIAAGEDWHQLVRWTLAEGYFGLENLALIPGTAGAAPIQNIGAYGVELQSCLERVHTVDIATGRGLVMSASECRLGYRDSIFKGSLRDQVVITAIELRLSRSARVNLGYPALAAFFRARQSQDVSPAEVFEAVVSIRRARLPDPSRLPNVGSFFKNPLVSQADAATLALQYPGLPVFPQANGMAKLAAAWLIERCGWKGYREGDVGVHPEHALVLVNYGEARGDQLLALAGRIVASVREAFGLELAVEPRVYGRHS
jgi:UDP-N-acetylmuramate dehydrogenase